MINSLPLWQKVLIRLCIILFWTGLLLFGLIYRFGFEFIPSKKKVLNVFTFTEIIPPELATRFMEETGVPVRVTYFQTNEEAIAKFSVTKGEGYDLVVLTDYAIETMVAEGLLAPINKQLITNYSKLDPRLLGHFFDPSNTFSIPLVWTVYVLGYNRQFFKAPIKPTIDLIFTDPAKGSPLVGGGEVADYKITMVDDPRECMFFAGQYLFNKTHGWTQTELLAIQEVLVKQKEWVENYSNDSIEYALASRSVPLAIIPAAQMIRFFILGEEWDIAIPNEGPLLAIEHICITKASEQKALAHEFIDFLISTNSAWYNSYSYGYYSSNVETYGLLGGPNKKYFQMLLQDDVLNIAKSVRNDTKIEAIEQIWLSVKSS